MPPRLRVFFAVLGKQPLKAAVIAWWWITRRHVRAWARLRVVAAGLPNSYRLWLAIHQPDPPPIPDTVELFTLAVHIHIANARDAHASTAAILSVCEQNFPRWLLYLTSAGGSTLQLNDPRVHVLPSAFESRATALAHVLQITDASCLIPLSAICTLRPGALQVYAQAFNPNSPAVLYADQDELAKNGQRCNPWFKPGWDRDLFLAQDYLSAACALPVEPAHRIVTNGDWPDSLAIYALLTKLLVGPQALPAQHVAYVAVTTPPHAWRENVPARAKLVHRVAGIAASAGPFGTVTMHHPLADPPPPVSIIVPTRDRLDLLEPCIAGVLHRTDYPALELFIVDNGSVEQKTQDFLRQCAGDPRVKIVRWPHAYNYSAINNFAVAQANGPYVCLLNNDTEVIDPTWLRAMMAHAVRPDVGAVGAQLLYPDRSIQHAGVVVGMGNAAGHAHRGLPQGNPGYFAQTLVAREATAVTAACLTMAKDRFEAVGGLDEKELAIAYNDVDLCLKLRRKGWRTVYVPQAVLIHHESKSRGLDFAPEHFARYHRELAVFQRRWDPSGFVDPTHHRSLDRFSEEYRLMI